MYIGIVYKYNALACSTVTGTPLMVAESVAVGTLEMEGSGLPVTGLYAIIKQKSARTYVSMRTIQCIP